MIRRSGFRPRMDRLDDRWLPSVAGAGLTPGLIAQAYGFNTAGSNGTGQTIAIVDAFHDPNLAGDLATFDQANHLPGQTAAQVAGFLSQSDQSGGQTNDGWAGEEALDVEWAHAAAPGARIVVVEAKSDSLGDLMAAVDTARNTPGVSVVSMSWGGAEFPQETAYDAHFTTPVGHMPVTFVASSGDSSALAGPEWPASSPNVVAVGGTSLQLGASGQIVNQSGWFGSGGGVSSFEPEPAFQAGVQSTGARTTPDVAIVGDPATGLSTYITSPSTGTGAWQVVGGTSASAQIWAGLLADANQARTAAGQTTLDTSTALAALYQAPGAFHPIQSGFNGYSAGSGYNLVTGLGTPNAGAVINALAHPGTASSTPVLPTPPSAVTANPTPPAPVTPTPPSQPVVPDPDDPVTTGPTSPVASPPTIPILVTPPPPDAASHPSPVSSGRTVVFVVPAPVPAFVTLTPNMVTTPSIPALTASLTAPGTSTAIGSLTAVPQSLSVATSDVHRIPDDDPAAPLPFEPSNDPLPAESEPASPQSERPDSDRPERKSQQAPAAPSSEVPAAPPAASPAPSSPAKAPAAAPLPRSVLPDPADLNPDRPRGDQTGGDEASPPAPTPGRTTDPAARSGEETEQTSEEPTRVSCAGVVLVSAAAVAWRYRLRKRSDLPQGPLDLFRCQF